MYAHFKGKVDRKLSDRIILDVNNVGYEIYMPENEIIEINDNENIVKVYTYLQVREDDMKLFGFLSDKTLEFFKKLISVNGVGPKVALGIISKIDPSDMCIAIATENILTLKSIPGIGPKMAQKIILELKDKVLKDEISDIKEKQSKISLKNPNLDEAITALQVLGYTEKNLKEVIEKINIKEDKVEDIIRKVLKEMQRN